MIVPQRFEATFESDEDGSATLEVIATDEGQWVLHKEHRARVEELEKENRQLKGENKTLRESGRASLIRSVEAYDTGKFPEELGKLWEKLTDAVVKADEETKE